MPRQRALLTLLLTQVLLLSAISTLSPSVLAAVSDIDTGVSQTDLRDISSTSNGGHDVLVGADDVEPELTPGEVIVNFTKAVSFRLENGRLVTGAWLIDKLVERFKVKSVTRIFSNTYKLTLPMDSDVLYVAKRFESLTRAFVQYAEPNGIAHTFLVPNDANYTQQWAHQVMGSEQAWDITTGDANVVVAIVDSGVDYNHPDLAANIWINTDEIPNNGIDDDQNGFVDDFRGWDFVDVAMTVYPGEDGSVPDNDPIDFLGHGTVLAGIVAAVTNNTIGIAGVSWKSKIMAVRSGFAVAGGGALLYDQVAAGIHYAADNGADIISMSFGGTLRSKVVYDAVKYACDKGILLVGAAGNDAGRIKTYPAAYEEVVGVTATDQYDNPAYFSNYGSWVEVAAPGVDILSTTCPTAFEGPYQLQYPYDFASGTSAATPYAAGLAALIWSRFPNMTRDQVRVQLRRTTVDLPPEGFDDYYGYGRISASEAIIQAPTEYDLLVFRWKLPFVSAPGEEETLASYPSGFNLIGSTQNPYGALADLQSNNNVYMIFGSYATATAPKTLYAHQETITIGAQTYYVQKSTSADASGTSLSASMANTGRKLWGKSVYNLTSISSIPSNTWTLYYRTWFSSSDGAAHADIDILIRQSDGTVRTTIATNVADSLALTTTAQTLSGTYSFPEYTVASQTDYLEIDYYVEVTTKKSGASAYLQIDDSTLPLADQTRAGIYLPSEFTVEAEFIGSSNAEAWTQLVWTIDSSFTTEDVSVTFQLFNYTANAYPTSGDGYISDTIGAADITKAQTIVVNPRHFRDTTGNWKIKVKATKSTSSQFYWLGDLVKCEVKWPIFSTKTTVLNFGTRTATGINVKLLVNGTERDSLQIYELQSGKSAEVACSWTTMNEAVYNVTTLVEYQSEPSNVTGDNAQSAYSWVRYGKAVRVPLDIPTIQGAVETTNRAIYSGKAVIQLLSGTYNEYDLVMQNTFTSLTLAGESSSTSIILGDPNTDCLLANSDNITISGLTIQDSYTAIKLWGNNGMVSDSVITSNSYGIALAGYSNNTLRNNVVSDNSGPAISLSASSGNTVINNTATNSQYGFQLGSINHTLFSSNTIINNYYGIWMTVSSNDVFINNNLTGNDFGLGVRGDTLQQFIHDIDTTNTVNGKPVYYLINQSNVIIEPASFPSVGYLGIVNSTNVSVRNINVSKSIQGIMFAFTTNSNIQKANSSYNTYGICFYNSNSTLVANSTLSNNYYGVYTWASVNNNMYQNTFSNDNYGIFPSKSNGNHIKGNTITNSPRGINVYSSDHVILEDNKIITSTYGIYLQSSINNTFKNNNVTSSTYGIYLYGSEKSVWTNNSMTGNNYNFFVDSSLLSQYIHYIDTSNKVNGKPMHYLINQTNLVIGPSTFPSIGFLGLVNSTNIKVENMTLPTNNGQGILLAYITDSIIRNLSSTSNYDGIYLLESTRTLVSGNTLSSNVYGIRMKNSYNNTVDSNVVTRIDRDSVYLTTSNHNIISGNTLANCSLTGYYGGIYMSDSGNNTIFGNTISSNKRGIRAYTSSDNVVYHNNFNKNTLQIYTSLSYNSWDNGDEGNYWSNYAGKDLNADGLGDTAYVIDANNRDRYPLMKLWSLYALSLRVMDWDLTDSIQGAYVYVDLNTKTSDANGWANWTKVSDRTLYVKVKWHGAWVNGTFRVVLDANKTISIQTKIFDIAVTTIESQQSAILQYVNVTIYNATGTMIRSGITASDGKVYLTNVPNSTLTFTAYEGASSPQVIANVTRTITTENQAETIVCDQNYVFSNQEWSIIADSNIFSLSLVPLSPSMVLLPASHPKKSFSMLKRFRAKARGLKERVKTIRSRQSQNRERKEVNDKNEWST